MAAEEADGSNEWRSLCITCLYRTTEAAVMWEKKPMPFLPNFTNVGPGDNIATMLLRGRSDFSDSLSRGIDQWRSDEAEEVYCEDATEADNKMPHGMAAHDSQSWRWWMTRMSLMSFSPNSRGVLDVVSLKPWDCWSKLSGIIFLMSQAVSDLCHPTVDAALKSDS